MKKLSASLPCQIIPLHDGHLLVPNINVAEVIGYQDHQSGDGEPWELGTLEWRGCEVPLLSLNQLLFSQPDQYEKESRVIIFNSVEADSNVPFFATLCSGIPHLTTINEDGLEESESEKGDYIHTLVELDDVIAIIPDLHKIQQLVNS